METKEKVQENTSVTEDLATKEKLKKKKRRKKRILIGLATFFIIILIALLALNFFIDYVINLRVESDMVVNTYASDLHDEDDDIYNIAIVGRNLPSNKYINENYETNSVKVVSLDFTNHRMVISNIDSYPLCISAINGQIRPFGQLYVTNNTSKEFVATLNYDLDLNIDRYIGISYTVNLFAQCIDILGGVDIELNQDELDYIGMDGKPGIHHLTGRQAMKYTENMYGGIDSAEAKITDRRTVLFNKCLVLMKNAPITTLIEIAKAAMPYIETDLTNTEIKSLILRIVASKMFNSIVSIRYPEDLRGDCYLTSNTKFVLYDYEGFVKDIQDNIYIDKNYEPSENVKKIGNKFREMIAEDKAKREAKEEN